MPRLADTRPRLGRAGQRPGAARLLFVCYYDPNGIATVYQNVAMWQELSEFQLEILNLWPGRGGVLRLPSTLDLNEFDGIVIHPAVSYAIEDLDSLDATLARPFEHYDGLKVLRKQDEQRMTAFAADYLARKRFDVLLTCVPEREWPKVYPRNELGDLTLVQVLTGYVTPTMRDMATLWNPGRPIDIGYRGSLQPLAFGRLGFEKRKIGYDVAEALAGGPLRVDISSRWEDRTAGSAWSDFLAASKATLGAESGSNLFDFDGGIERWCRGFEKANSGLDRYGEAFYRKADAEYLCHFEGNVDYAQVSPRHFEAAAAQSVQILYEGTYSDIFLPDRHFLPLRRDLANLLDALADERRCRDLTECAFSEIIANRKYGFAAFVERVERALGDVLARKGRRRPAVRSVRSGLRRAVLLAAADPVLGPRFDWMATSLAADHEVCEIGTYRFGVDGGAPSVEYPAERRVRLRVERTRHASWWIPPPSAAGIGISVGYQKLLYLASLVDAPESVLRSAIGALDARPDDLDQFRQLGRHVVNSSAALLEAAKRTGRYDLVVATDLDTLAAGVVLRDETNALLLYDAHEFWPYALHGMRHWQSEFWASFSHDLVAAADIAVTVSPPLATVMADEYGRAFGCVPNCALRADAAAVDINTKLAARAGEDTVVFLFQGAFAPGRGLELLLHAWRHVVPSGRLLMRGPGNGYRDAMVDLARSLGLLGRTVFFPDAVTEQELIATAAQADYGVIPYEPISINNRLACPNKLSQYLAAGLPVVCNELEFVRSLLVDNRIGCSVAFSDETATAATFNRLIARRDDIPILARRARAVFEEKFNWEVVFQPLRQQILAAERARPMQAADGGFDLTWLASPTAMRIPHDGLPPPPPPPPPTVVEVAAAAVQPAIALVERVASDMADGAVAVPNRVRQAWSAMATGLRGGSPAIDRAVRRGAAPIRRAGAIAAARFKVISVLLGDSAGTALLACGMINPLGRRRFLVEAARVLLARHGHGVMLPVFTEDRLDLYVVPAELVRALDLLAEAQDIVATAAARGVAACTLNFIDDPNPRPELIAGDRYVLTQLPQMLQRHPRLVAELILGPQPPRVAAPVPARLPRASTHYFEFLTEAVRRPGLVPLLERIDRASSARPPAPPFDRVEAAAPPAVPLAIPGTIPATVRRRSVLFLNNNYYHHFYLAQALRRRGWDAIVASTESPESVNARFYHGADLSLWDPDPERFRTKLRDFFDTIAARFRLVHFYGQGQLGIFPENWENEATPRILPWDLLVLKQRGVRLSYSPSGCLDGVSQSAIRDFTGVCRKCVWELHPEVCSDERNTVWGRKLDLVFDMISTELDWSLEWRRGGKYIREPLTSAMDPQLWHSQLDVPDELRVPRAPGEHVVYHAVGNYAQRRQEGRDIKGTGAVFDAVSRLRDDGIKVKLEFVSDLPSTQVRFVQSQAEIIVDQLNYGRYGATAREGMMLGKPTICFIDPRQPPGVPPSRALAECPLISATEETIYAVLKDLLLSPQRRVRIGTASRAYAMKWHSADACALRFERVYDRLMAGLPLEDEPLAAAA